MLTNGNKYYVSFVDHFSKYTWLFQISAKSSVMQIFCSFQKLVERQFNCKIKSIQTNWVGECRSFHTYFANIGIQHRITSRDPNIASITLIHPNKMDRLNGNTVTSLKQASHFYHIVMFLTPTGMTLFLWPHISLIAF